MFLIFPHVAVAYNCYSQNYRSGGYRAATANYVAVVVDQAAAAAAAAERVRVENNPAVSYAGNSIADTTDNVPMLADNTALNNIDNVPLATENAIAIPLQSRFKRHLITLKYAFPIISILATPIWLLGGFSGWGARSPIGLNVC
mgnify:CR=1 FL=1